MIKNHPNNDCCYNKCQKTELFFDFCGQIGCQWNLLYRVKILSRVNTNPEPVDLLSISSLVPRAKAGNDAAREEICRQLQDYLRLMADRHLDAGLRRKLNPSDVVQQTMIRMIDGFANFRGETTPEFYGWLNRILRNEINAARRNNHRAKRNVDRDRPTDRLSRCPKRFENGECQTDPKAAQNSSTSVLLDHGC